jgi:hypothetical protein
MTEWLVRLQGEKLDLEEASSHFRGADLEVRQEDGGYYLASTDLRSMTESGEVLKRGKELLKVMNGILKLIVGNHQPVTADGLVVRADEAGKRDQYIHVGGALTIRTRLRAAAVVVKSDGITELPEQAPPRAASWMAIAMRDNKVAKAFRLFNEPTYVNLYKVVEIIESDLESETGGNRRRRRKGEMSALVERGWATGKEIEWLKHTANSPKAIGDEARHGREFDAPRQGAMPLGDAQDLTGALLSKWLQTKAIDSKQDQGYS